MSRRILSFALILCMMAALLPQTTLLAHAGESSGTCGDNLTWTLDEDTGTLTISGTGEMVTGSNNPWRGSDLIRTVIINPGVTSIGSYAFAQCANLTSASIPDSVTHLDSGAFDRCTSLKQINLPNNVTSLGASCFSGCSSLENITLPDSLASIGYYAFGRCAALTSVVIPEGVVSTGNELFSDCSSLTSVTIPASLTSFDYSFSRCTKLAEILVNENNPSYCNDVHGVLFNKEKTQLLKAPAAISGEYSIPDSVTDIAGSAFFQCANLTDVTIPDGVTTIGGSAFNGCSGLENIVLPKSLTSIAGYTFASCRELKSVTIPEGVTSIGNKAFAYSINLSDLIIPGSVTSIGDYAFHNCSALYRVFFDGDAPEIGEYVFSYTSKDGTFLREGIILFYIEGKEGWTTPRWNGYLTATWAGSHTHSYTDTVTPPTCTEQGYTTHACYCGDSYVDSYVDALGHAWDEGRVTTEPTETADGVKTYTCTRCGDTKTEIIPAVNHTHKYTESVVEPTCTEQGYTVHTCACGDNYKDQYVDALGHDWGEWVESKAATEEETGEETRTCNRCEATETRETEIRSCPSAIFADVDPGKWYHVAIDFVLTNKLFFGIDDTHFAPNGKMTRAMFVAVLWRMDGRPEPKTANTFTDVPDGEYYAKAVSWASENAIVAGVGDQKFAPGSNVTREQMASFMYRYARYKGYDIQPRADLSKFPDADKVSDFAKEPLSWANAAGLISGVEDTATGIAYLKPLNHATRAECAAILQRFWRFRNRLNMTEARDAGNAHALEIGFITCDPTLVPKENCACDETIQYYPHELVMENGGQAYLNALAEKAAEEFKAYLMRAAMENPDIPDDAWTRVVINVYVSWCNNVQGYKIQVLYR